jgi:hypothetical protein
LTVIPTQSALINFLSQSSWERLLMSHGAAARRIVGVGEQTFAAN